MSTYSVLSVLTSDELQQGLGARNVSFHRLPRPLRPGETLHKQSVPRHIVQTGATWHKALIHHAGWMKSWMELNPEYEYSFFCDEHARRFVELHGSPRELAAYRRIKTGSQRADLFRVIFLKVAGGIYADLDEELRHPLSELFGGADVAGRHIARDATAIVGTFWPFEFLVYAPAHPIMKHTAEIMTSGILLQVAQQRNGSKHACKTPHECVIRVTGPLAYTSGVGSATHVTGGCRNRLRTPVKGDCDRSQDPMLQKMHLCLHDAGTIWNSWSCGFARHWDCRNSIRRRACPSKHYARMKLQQDFFELSDGPFLP